MRLEVEAGQQLTSLCGCTSLPIAQPLSAVRVIHKEDERRWLDGRSLLRWTAGSLGSIRRDVQDRGKSVRNSELRNTRYAVARLAVARLEDHVKVLCCRQLV